METFLAYWFMGSLVLIGWGWRVAWLQFKRAEHSEKTLGDCEASWSGESEAWNAERKGILAELDEAVKDRDELVKKIMEKSALPPPVQPPAPRRIRAGYATIRKAVEANNRQEAEIEEARERDTAFQG